MNVLVTGGAGYIGSHAAQALHLAGHNVVVMDNLYRGHQQAVPMGVAFSQLDLNQTNDICELLSLHKIECVMHFAALAYVGESIEQPLTYYQVNVGGTLSLLQAMEIAGVRRIVFSSSCTTYGQPKTIPLTENLPQQPISPYGWTKFIGEQLIRDYARAHDGFAYAFLRYFNVAGCAEDGSLGEDHRPESHLIPNLLFAAIGKESNNEMTIFGDDYNTPDGTCIRDYIHVEDLAQAHIAVMTALRDGDQRFYNLGIGKGYSVKQVLDAAKRICGVDIPCRIGSRRDGDAPQLYADASKIKEELDWNPRFTDINAIVQTAWKWFQSNPNGYGD